MMINQNQGIIRTRDGVVNTPRRRVAADLARFERGEIGLIAAACIAIPGLGHVRATDGRFEWIPANCTTVLRH